MTPRGAAVSQGVLHFAMFAIAITLAIGVGVAYVELKRGNDLRQKEIEAIEKATKTLEERTLWTPR